MANTTIGTIQLIATIDTSRYKKGAEEIDSANKKLEGSASTTEKKSNSSFMGIAKVGLAAVAAAAIAVGALIVKNIGSAVSRVDTLNNFPKVMANLGYGGEEASQAIDKLDKGVRGLPTSLDAISSAMQNIAPSSKSISEATDLTLALNNALLAGGKDAAIQSTAMEQFSQAIAKGKPDMMEWRTLATAMPAQLKQISNSLGFETWQNMAEAVADGSLSFDKVKESIVSLNKDGLGQLPSFADQAKNATGGLSTGVAQMNTAITRGIANIIQTIGSERINKAMGVVGKGIETALSFISKAIIGMVAVWKWAEVNVVPVVMNIWNLLKPLREFIGNQFMAAWRDLQAAFERIRVAIEPFLPQLKQIGLIIAGVLLVPIALLIGFMIGLATAITLVITFIARLVGWLSTLYSWWVNLGAQIQGFSDNATRNITNFAQNSWAAIQNAFGNVANWFRDKFNQAWANIRSAFSGVAGFFQGLWGQIVSIFGNIGTAVGNAIGNGFRSVVNGLINGAAAIINGFINAINGAVETINKIPGVNIGTISNLGIPQLAEGGIVSKPTLAMIGEGRESEAVIPLSKLDKILSEGGGGGNVTVNVNLSGIAATSRSALRDIGKEIISAVDDELRANGKQAIMGAR